MNTFSKRIKPIISILLACCMLLTACASNTDTQNESSSQTALPSCSRDIFAMDTYMTLTCYGEQCEAAADAAESEIKRLDDLLSVGNADSEISLLNSSGSITLSQDSQLMIEKSIELFNETDGAFDITIYPLMQLWGFTTHDYAVPDESQLADVLSLVGSDRLSYENGSLTLQNGMGVDLGGIAKGYASDRLSVIFADYDLTCGLISLGGNVQLYGSKPDGSPWKCGIRDPLHPDDIGKVIGVLQASDCAVITSGAYERYFTDDEGNIYHHIIDPKTGFPADSGLISSTVVAKSGMVADGLSTALYIMGLAAASDFWRSGSEDFEMILMSDEHEVYITEGLEDSFSCNYPLHIIHRSEDLD